MHHDNQNKSGIRRRVRPAVTAIGAAGLLLGAFAPAAGASAPVVASPAGVARHSVRVSPFGHPGRAGRATTAPASRPAATGAAGATLYVSPSGTDAGTCRLKSASCLTIGYALTQAPTTATIDLATGTYAEQVVIPGTDTISLVGAGSGKTSIDPTAITTSVTDSDSPDPVYPIVYVQAGATANIKGVTVNGSGASGSFTGCGEDFTGVYYHDAAGALTSSIVTGVALPGDLFGCQDGLGVYVSSDSGSTSNVTMAKDTVTGYQKNGITCDDAGTTCSVTGAKVIGAGSQGANAQNGVQAYSAASFTLTSSTVSGDTYAPSPGNQYSGGATGVLLIDVGSATVTSVTASRDDAGIYDYYDGSAPSSPVASIGFDTASTSTGVDMNGNTIADGIDVVGLTTGKATVNNDTVLSDGEYGVGVLGSAGVTVDNVTANKDGDGIMVGSGSTGANVYGNFGNNDTVDGIMVDSSVTTSTFKANNATNDKAFDFADASSGGGTAGTANTWSGDSCRPTADSSPEGLC